MLKIAMGDLKHKTAGVHSSFMPLGISYIASYLLTNVPNPDNIKLRFYVDANAILEDIKLWKPDMIALSNYCWNTELSNLIFNYAKKINPNIFCVSGGPEFPDEEERKNYLLDRKKIDFYIYQEGEIAFTELIKKIIAGAKLLDLKNSTQKGIMSIGTAGNLIIGEPIPRIMDMDQIPSPYLNGIMDRWFDGHYAPSILTNKGCPFTCTFCKASNSWYSSMAKFSIERIKKELNYIAQKMQPYPNTVLIIYDTNFGVFSRDEEIARHISNLRDKFGWPNAFIATTSKNNYERILRISSILQNRMLITGSLQSTNLETLKVIKRQNISLEKYLAFGCKIRKLGMPFISELIVPLPKETKSSFFEGIKIFLDAGVDQIVPYTTMMLKGTPLASKESRKKYKMKTKYRLIPRQFGAYAGQKCFETEEVCIGTDTMPFEEYLECRGFGLISALLFHYQFDVIRRHLKELDINAYDYLIPLWEMVKSGNTKISEIYNEYIQETKNELWDSKKELCEYFSKPENYEKLLSGELGDNLIRKYKTKIIIEKSAKIFELAYDVIVKVGATKITEEIKSSLNSAKQWVIAGRDINAVTRGKPTNVNITLNHDVS
ncbi:MAG: cobalamin-dependent protein, partial [Patescibacteria group bacterium]